jgi:hypothetical protein
MHRPPSNAANAAASSPDPLVERQRSLPETHGGQRKIKHSNQTIFHHYIYSSAPVCILSLIIYIILNMSSPKNQLSTGPPAERGENSENDVSAADFINMIKTSGLEGYKILKRLNDSELNRLLSKQEDV